MNDIKNGGPAFPQIETELSHDRDYDSNYDRIYSWGGLSLRDYFAAKAMAACVAAPVNNVNYSGNPEQAAKWAYEYADAMLRAREQS